MSGAQNQYLHVTWHDAAWHDKTRQDMTWHHMTPHDTTLTLTPYTSHLTPHTSHLTPYTLHVTCYMLHVTCYILHVTFYIFTFFNFLHFDILHFYIFHFYIFTFSHFYNLHFTIYILHLHLHLHLHYICETLVLRALSKCTSKISQGEVLRCNVNTALDCALRHWSILFFERNTFWALHITSCSQTSLCKRCDWCHDPPFMTSTHLVVSALPRCTVAARPRELPLSMYGRERLGLQSALFLAWASSTRCTCSSARASIALPVHAWAQPPLSTAFFLSEVPSMPRSRSHKQVKAAWYLVLQVGITWRQVPTRLKIEVCWYREGPTLRNHHLKKPLGGLDGHRVAICCTLGSIAARQPCQSAFLWFFGHATEPGSLKHSCG